MSITHFSRPSELSIWAEDFGRYVKTAGDAKVLLLFLRHPAPVVVQGAIYGLEDWLDDADVRAEFVRVAEVGPSATVRDLAAGTLRMWVSAGKGAA